MVEGKAAGDAMKQQTVISEQLVVLIAHINALSPISMVLTALY